MTGVKPSKIMCSHVRVICMHVNMHWHKQNAIKKHWLQKKQTEKRNEECVCTNRNQLVTFAIIIICLLCVGSCHISSCTGTSGGVFICNKNTSNVTSSSHNMH